ncbi:hypothetical protein GCM10010174_03140 [Kutzneria viridogrisea]|uniref:Uncharacterized protein n=1 Tax=Kutzneria viridogrisea TaxID=47990 RepID=A0ABR6BRB5_9PSEU|nr:hypothetical protein [Kutzneria viridogrisea]
MPRGVHPFNSRDARIAARVRWDRESNRTAATEPMRQALYEKYERIVDPNNILASAERARRAEEARRTDLMRASRIAAKRRSARARARREEAEQLRRNRLGLDPIEEDMENCPESA